MCVFNAAALAQESLERLERLIDSPPAGDAVEPLSAPGYLGIVVDDRTRSADGVAVLVVRSDSPAMAAGMRAGDRIVAVDGVATPDIDAFAAAAAGLQAGRSVPVEALRGGRRFEFNVTPAAGDTSAAPSDTTTARVPIEARSPSPPREYYGDERPRLGLVIGPLRTRTYPLLGVGTSWGVVVEDIVAGSPADAYGVPRGALVLAINGVRVDRVSDAMLLMDQIDPARPVELTYKLGGRAYRQAIPLVGSPERVIGEELPPLPAPPPDIRDAAPAPPPLPEPPAPPPAEPTPADPKPPEAELRLSPPKDADEDALRVKAMQRELDELRRRAAAIEEALKELREE